MAGRRALGGDPLLLPRIEQYAHNNRITDIDATVEYLRRSYREYQRKQVQPFRKCVIQAVRIVQQKMRDTPEELRLEEDILASSRRRRSKMDDSLQSIEEEHLKRRGYSESDGDIREESVVSAKNATDSSDSEEEQVATIERTPKPSYDLLNSSLIATYSNKPALVIQNPTFNGPSVLGSLQVENQKEEAVPKPAFASPEVIASTARSKKQEKRFSKSKELKKRERQKENNDEGPTKKAKQSSEKIREPQNVRFKDFGGLGETIRELVDFMYPVLHPSVFDTLGLEAMKGLLLHGPPGCGKTMLAEAIANEASVPFFKISAPEVVSGMSGESEAKLRNIFTEASIVAPAIIFIDEIDAICSKRETAQREMERRIVTQLMICMDDASSKVDNEFPRPLLVIGATNRPDSLDQALRRRFEREICLGIPDENARLHILKILCNKLRLEGEFDFKQIARKTPGFAGADLKALTKEAGLVAIRRVIESRNTPQEEENEENIWWRRQWTPEELQTLSITMQDFEMAIGKVKASTMREGFTEIPSVTWDDVGALDSVREELDLYICRSIKHPDDYEALNFTDNGYLLYGPPGCGKTLIAKAVANAAGANFIYIKAGELFNKYVGESERAVRQLFSRARACAPCLVFFDEVDALAPTRGNEANAATDRVVNQLLVEMDGLELRKGIFLIAATNRPNMIDQALLRPGRLGKRICVPLPDARGRESILKALLRKLPVSPDVDVANIAQDERCTNFTGADLHGLVQEACGIALRERIPLWQENNGQRPAENITLTHTHLKQALNGVKPSVSCKEYTMSKQTSEKTKAVRQVTPCPGAL